MPYSRSISYVWGDSTRVQLIVTGSTTASLREARLLNDKGVSRPDLSARDTHCTGMYAAVLGSENLSFHD